MSFIENLLNKQNQNQKLNNQFLNYSSLANNLQNRNIINNNKIIIDESNPSLANYVNKYSRDLQRPLYV